LPLNPNRPLIMGILNVTPDSFSDGGQHNSIDAAIEHATKMAEDGADIIDVGGESTRPGAEPVNAQDEISRTIPVIKALSQDGRCVSIDTMKAEVASAALEAGASVINDVSACTHDPAMEQIAAESGAGVVLMHMRGTPIDMQTTPSYGDVIADISSYLATRAEALISAGADTTSIILDPGIGFGKTLEHNLALLAEIDKLSSAGFPLLVGLSRKSFIGQITGRDVNERLAGSLAGLVWCILKGVNVLRVHDVPESIDAVRITEALKEA
jgi:dihydropteroate synthase